MLKALPTRLYLESTKKEPFYSNHLMHICFITNEYPTEGEAHGGVGTIVFFLSRAFVQSGHRVSVVGGYSIEGTERLMNGNLVIHRFAHQKGKGYKNILRLGKRIAQIHRKAPIDAIEATETGLAFLKIPSGIKKVIRMHGGHHFFSFAESRKKEWRKVLLERNSFAKADYFLAVSDFVGRETARLMKKPLEYRVINNLIDTTQFYEASSEKVIPYRLLFVGSVVEKKGIRQLVQAMPKILAEIPKVELIVVGKHANVPGTRMPYLPLLEKEISPEIRDRIQIKGPVSHAEVIDYIESAEVCVYPSHMEAMPMAWLEALAMGKAFVGSFTGPGKEVVNDGRTGLLCNPHDPADIAEKVITMLTEKDKAIEMGKAARKEVYEKFELNRLIHKNLNFYQGITA